MEENKKEEGIKSEYQTSFPVVFNQKRYSAFTIMMNIMMDSGIALDFLKFLMEEDLIEEFILMTNEIGTKAHKLAMCKDDECTHTPEKEAENLERLKKTISHAREMKKRLDNKNKNHDHDKE